MTSTIFPVRDDVTTLQVNRAFRTAIDEALEMFGQHYPDPDTLHVGGRIERDERLDSRRRYIAPGVLADKPTRRWVHGIHNGLRSTLVGHWDVSTREFMICFPSDYAGWDRARPYERLRVNIYDRLVHGSGSLITVRDTAKPGVKVGA